MAGFIFSFLSETRLHKELRFFALHSVHQDGSFEFTESDIGPIFLNVTIRRHPFDLGRVKTHKHDQKLKRNLLLETREKIQQENNRYILQVLKQFLWQSSTALVSTYLYSVHK